MAVRSMKHNRRKITAIEALSHGKAQRPVFSQRDFLTRDILVAE